MRTNPSIPNLTGSVLLGTSLLLLGGCSGNERAARPTPPLALAERLSCPLLAAIGAEDQTPSPAIGAELRERARRSGQEGKVDVYDGAGHAFFADYRPTYRPEPAARLWEAIVPFFSGHLASSSDS